MFRKIKKDKDKDRPKRRNNRMKSKQPFITTLLQKEKKKGNKNESMDSTVDVFFSFWWLGVRVPIGTARACLLELLKSICSTYKGGK